MAQYLRMLQPQAAAETVVTAAAVGVLAEMEAASEETRELRAEEETAERETAERAAEETAEMEAAAERWQEWMMEAAARRTRELREEVVDGRWRWWVGRTGRAVEDAGSAAEAWMERAAADATAAGAEANSVKATAARWRAASEWGAALAPGAAEDMAATMEWEAGMAAVEAEEARGSTITGRLWSGEVERRMDEMAAQLCCVGHGVEWAVGEWRAAETREEAWSEEAEDARDEAEDRDVWAEEAEERAERAEAELERIRRTNHMLRARVREAAAAEAAAVERAAEMERRAEAVEMGAENTALRRAAVYLANWRQM